MNTDAIVMTGNNTQTPSQSITEMLRQHEAENIRRAEEKEKMLLNRVGFIDGLILLFCKTKQH